jgi:DNA-binding GntR family transcriptional regulator
MRDIDANNAAYSAILSKISEGDLEPGAWLREGTLAAELGTSRTPVREALRSLAAENLVEIVRNRGARVRNWSEEEVYEIYGLRALIEGYGARLASQRATARHVKELERIHANMERALSERDEAFLDTVAEINAEFHGTVISIASSPMLEVLIANLSSVPVVKRAFRGYEEEDLQRIILQHKDILRAIREKDGDLAQAAMSGHILAARYAATKVLHSDHLVGDGKTGT